MLKQQRTKRTGTALVLKLKSFGFAGAALAAATLSSNAYAEAQDSDLAELKKQIQLLQGTVVSLQKRVEKAESIAAKADNQAVKLNSRVEKAETSAAKAESQTAELNSKVENAATQVAQTGTGDSPPATQEDILGLTTDLENFKWQWQRERDLHTAISTRNLTLGGTVQVGYEWNQNGLRSNTANQALPSNYVGAVNANNSFFVNAALLRFSGNLYKDYEEGRNLEFLLSGGVSPQTGSASFNLLDAQISYNLFPTINLQEPLMKVTLGQQLLPWGLEVNATEDLKPVIINAQFTQGTTTGLGVRQIGLFIRGDLFPQVDYGANYRAPIMEYAVGVINGNGPNTLDNNSSKDFVGHLDFVAPVDYNSWFREMKIGGSGYIGTQNMTQTYYVNPLSPTTTATQYVPNGVKNRAGLDFSYNHHPYGFTFEWTRSWDQAYQGISPSITSQNYANIQGEGMTATAYYNLGAQFVKSFRDKGRYDDFWPKTYQFMLRWDSWNQNLAKTDVTNAYLIPGLNIFFAETTKIQFNYFHQFQTSYTQPRSDEFWAQIQYGF